MTRAQQRAVALSTARYQLRQLKVNLLEASAADAHAALDDNARHYQPHVPSRGEEKGEKVTIPDYRARRWAVERTHSWLNRSRRLLMRWEKKGENYLVFLHLACAQLIFAKIAVSR